ncbi:MAG: hypothetical protein QOD27_276 [Microbacteriaceae bacterium]|nr:hypothetical protein [Microbacteriaceae bacterium]
MVWPVWTNAPRAKRMRVAAVALIVAAGIALATTGCTASTAKAPSPTASASHPATASPLNPVVPATLTADTAKTETVRIADAIETIVGPSKIVHVDDHSQLVAATKTTGSYYGVLRTITLDPSVNPVSLAATVVAKLKAAGWVQRQASDTGGTSMITLSSDPTAAESWFVLIGGDSSVAGQSVVTVQLLSPDLP